mmetsp:Transcript_4748/g.8525  ORF Transcript_4748/g.8525 Transcript_4748/m.8525 type:complete len:497 (-) Transcript_4748:2701-4191(-)|eukprot:CAMPEP_0203763858 /NCGR_PEP_ID=MMETSP0098-20131031/16991_1 /ASSEMBLY_ACC=CAM_ASM_000208 /TAXON_ID=96639 /ORGANISM=" , Strain NY0313808BC1" /LENGTH=496 /DNA_ID=CAMNT_0050659167 /DNA_START=1993 /DNA_END=3483 /DNA_ORIENTATION=-
MEAEQAHEGKHEEKVEEGKNGDDGEIITMRFLIQPEGFPHFVDLPSTTTVEQVKLKVATDLQLSPTSMVLSGAELAERPDLSHLEPDVEYQVELRIEQNVVESQSEYKLPDQIDVVVHFDDIDEPSRTVKVNIVSEKSRKPYLGGYRNTKNGIQYHHASTQRFRERRQEDIKPRKTQYCRDTQTAVEISRTVQTRRENGTQMARPDLYIDPKRDRAIEARPYFDSTQHHALKVRSTLTIQRYWRGYIGRKKALALRDAKATRAAKQERLLEQKEMEEKQQHEREVARRMNPTSAADFEVLYNELENWRQHETRRIHSIPDLEEKQRLLLLEELLLKETKLLQTIDKLKISANESNRKKRINKVLSMMASPKKWQLSDGDTALVHTPFTTRAKELLELYNGLNIAELEVGERLDILLHVKWTAKEFDCELTRDIVDLIDREADLLNRGRPSKSLFGLRKRLSTLFLQFVETPDFNPEAARFQKIPREFRHRPQIAPK